MIVSSRNVLFHHDAFPLIMERYNEELFRKGKVNKRVFYNKEIAPKVANYSLPAWYNFCKKYVSPETGIGKIESTVMVDRTGVRGAALAKNFEEREAHLRSNQEATQKGINSALNAGALFYDRLWEKYNSGQPLDSFEKSCLKDAMFKAMKSQDSRIHAIGKIREDSREEEKMDRAFNQALYDNE